MAGTFGYELDVTAIAPEEQEQIPGQIARYQTLQPLLQSGDYYRLASARDGGLDAQMVVSRERDRALLLLVRVLNAPNQMQRYIRLRGLDPAAVYEDQDTHRRYSGDVLCRVGFRCDLPEGDFQGESVYFLRV